MTAALDALPPRWRDDRLVLSDRHILQDARVLGDDEGIVVLSDGASGVSVAGYGPDGRAAGIVTSLVDAGQLRPPLRWMSLPRAADLPPRVRDALHVDPLPGWDWMSTTSVGDAPGTDAVVRLDLATDLPDVLDCLAAANPTTESDPTSPHEAGWWGVRDGGRLIGVIGAGRRGGAADDGFSWHLHGLGVRPQERRGGLGTALMVAATAEGLAAGADWVSLGVWAANEPALRIYRRLGFRTDHQGRSYRPR
ncbi:MAG TPA: GNAT family N-acetyltransferase [Cellulomonas sp.]